MSLRWVHSHFVGFVFPGHTCHFVGFVMRWLNLLSSGQVFMLAEPFSSLAQQCIQKNLEFKCTDLNLDITMQQILLCILCKFKVLNKVYFNRYQLLDSFCI